MSYNHDNVAKLYVKIDVSVVSCTNMICILCSFFFFSPISRVSAPTRKLLWLSSLSIGQNIYVLGHGCFFEKARQKAWGRSRRWFRMIQLEEFTPNHLLLFYYGLLCLVNVYHLHIICYPVKYILSAHGYSRQGIYITFKWKENENGKKVILHSWAF